MGTEERIGESDDMHGDGGCGCPTERLKVNDLCKVIRPGEPWDGELVEIVISEWSEEAKRTMANTCCYQVLTVKNGLLWYAMPHELERVAAHK